MPFTVTDHVYPTFFSPGVKSNHSFSVSDRCLLSDAKIQALHYHSGIELGICLSGQGKTVIQNRVYAYRAGDFSLIMPRCPHLSASAPGTVSRWLWLSFSPDFLKQTGMELSSLYPLWQKRGSSGSFSPAECPLLFKDVTEIAEAAKRAVAAGEPKDSAADFSDMEKAVLALRLATLLTDACLSLPPYSDRASIQESKWQPILSYISSHFSEKEAMREERLAALAGCSPATFRLGFKTAVGIPPKTFIIRTKLAAAERMLRCGDYTVTDIAFSCGFEQVSCFNRSFRAAFGVPPLTYRRTFSKQNPDK